MQADKSKTVAIIKSDAYSKRVHTFPAAKVSSYFPKILPTSIKKPLKNTKTVQLNHRQTKNKIPSPKETFTPTLKHN